MKMFKRFAAALLAGVMVLAMLTACGGGGGGEATFETKVQEAYLAAVNEALGTKLANNGDVKAFAAERLEKIADGKIANADATATKEIDGGESMLGSMVCVEDVADAKQVYDAIYYEEAAAPTIAADKDNIAEAKTAIDYIVALGAASDVDIEVTGLGVATKTVGGKTYVALGFKLTMKN